MNPLQLDHTPAVTVTRARQWAEQLKGALKAASQQDPKDWARQICRRKRKGEHICQYTLEKAVLALGSEAEEILSGSKL